ncbi:MAG: exodeoxyribonuclease VII small subunit, partial [Chloroflexota bacterium]
YETAFAALQEVVSMLENEEKSLKEAMNLFERGQQLAKHCADLLEKAELKVQSLLGNQTVESKSEE